ncbi:MAG: ABC transporter ATP-binding protein [Culicoidibacterales bacterium]
METIMKLQGVKKIYGKGETLVHALDGVDLEIFAGEVVVLLGPSGSGKSTMLNVMSGLDKIDSGTIHFQSEVISQMSDAQLTKFRRDKIGFIFQSYNLLPNLTISENVEVGRYIAKDKLDVEQILQSVEMNDHRKKFPFQLSGGQQQRISIARALAKNPQLMFCDEPTGALDEHTGKKVLEVLQKVNKEYGTTLIIVTHNPGIAAMANRVIRMNSGKIVEHYQNEKPIAASEVLWA